jgi:hypothetical protein
MFQSRSIMLLSHDAAAICNPETSRKTRFLPAIQRWVSLQINVTLPIAYCLCLNGYRRTPVQTRCSTRLSL